MVSKTKLSVVCLALANALVYAFNALFYCFLPLYFNDRFSPVEAGIVLSVGPAVSIVAPLFWGMLADRAKYKNTVLICTVLLSSVFFFSMKFDVGFFAMCVLVGVTMLFMSPFAGLIDTITLEYTTDHAIPYGPIRVLGTLGFGIISLVSGMFSGRDIDIIFYIFVGMALVCALVLLGCPRVEGHAHTDGKKTRERVSLKPLLRAHRLWIIVGFMLLCQFAYSYYCNFYPSYLRDVLLLPEWIWGLNVLILVLGEIPFFFLYNRLFAKLGIRPLLFASVIGSAARYLLLGLCEGVTALIINNLLTGFLVTVVTYCGAMYITAYIAPELQATGQNLMYCIGQGIARVFGGVLGGVIESRLGTTGGMYLFGGLLAIAAVIGVILILRDKSPEWRQCG
ncbi:MAG: MFS transporter [Clostridia bacterium]|nr:MFS transporter [Clostridia bacterium]